MWRNPFRRFGRPRSRPSEAVVDQVRAGALEPFDASPHASSRVLSQIEQTALEIYAEHGLPTRPGHYRRGRRARTWTWLGEHLTPEARWAAIMERPPEEGWRYGVLADLGRTGPPEVRAAADLLARCAFLRERRPAGPATAEDLDLAIRLGADWRTLQRGRVRIGADRLKLTPPDEKVEVPARPSPPRRLTAPKSRS